LKEGNLSESFDRLVEVMARLRSPNGCPWDREQTLLTLRTYLLEETYETLDAIDRGDNASLKEELGDLLLEVVFFCQIGAEDGLFTIEDVAGGIHDKLVRRHPHVFGAEKAGGAREALGRWEEMKNKEREASGETSVLSGVPRAMPALLRAFRISNKAAMVGFDWDNVAQTLEKVEEELAELRKAIDDRDAEGTAEELGDLLFAAANVGRLAGVDPETALQAANGKFTRRFMSVEEGLKRLGLRPSAKTREEMERLWEEAKAQSRGAR
jgi:MazG family protein